MCEFISWVEEDDKVYFLTKKELATKKGKELIKYCDGKDLGGHGACRRYFFGDESSKRGKNKECSNFSSSLNFPEQVVKSFLKGDFNNKYFSFELGKVNNILSQPALAEYKKIEQPALAEYKKIEQSAWAEYEKIEQPALAEYQKIKLSALAEYKKIEQSALAEYQKIEQSALAEYEKICRKTFFSLIRKKENRSEKWQTIK